MTYVPHCNRLPFIFSMLTFCLPPGFPEVVHFTEDVHNLLFALLPTFGVEMLCIQVKKQKLLVRSVQLLTCRNRLYLGQIWQLTHHDKILILSKIWSQCFDKERKWRIECWLKKKLITAHFMHLQDMHFITPLRLFKILSVPKIAKYITIFNRL